MEIHVEPGGEEHRGELARFSCWNGSPTEPWAQEAENHIRGWVLSDSDNVILFRTTDAELAAVTGFSERAIDVPVLQPQRHPAWHLDVVGVATELQGAGIGTFVVGATFDKMKELDAERVLVSAHVHKDNAVSLRMAEKVGLSPLVAKDDTYWVLLAELEPA